MVFPFLSLGEASSRSETLREQHENRYRSPRMISCINNYIHIGLMPDQTIKHNNAPPEFLLILIPAAFLAVVLATAWKFILGFALLLTGNNLWQGYQWTKLAQQVDPAFSRLVIEQKGEVSPLELAARAQIGPAVANRYLNNKAVDLGGVSYQSPNGSQVYSFLTVGTLGSTFVDIEPEASLYQKLAELEPAQSAEVIQFTPASSAPETLPANAPSHQETAVTLTVEEVPVSLVEEASLPENRASSLTIEAPTAEPVAPVVVTPVEVEVAATPDPPAIEAPSLPQESVVQAKSQPIEPPLELETITANESVPAEASDFTQALRNIFNNPPASVPEAPVAEVAAVPTMEIISQADLAKRLDVHASTIYKRRSDVSFVDWTRNRDPEGIAWGYSRETKEFYRIG
jgi:hypothetical protein